MKNSAQEASKTVKKKKKRKEKIEEESDGDTAKTHCILWKIKKELLI